MLQSLRPNLSKICWYVVYLGGIAGCSACTNPPPGQPNETNKQAPLVPPPIDHKDPGAGEPPSDPPVQPSPFQQAVQQLKDDPEGGGIYEFLCGYDSKKVVKIEDAHQAWNKVFQYIDCAGSDKTAVWLIEQGHIEVNGQEGKLPLERLLNEWFDSDASYCSLADLPQPVDAIVVRHRYQVIFSSLLAKGATLPQDQIEDLLAKAEKQGRTAFCQLLIKLDNYLKSNKNKVGDSCTMAIAENKKIYLIC